jgi:tol-pal system protein YbgF
MSTKSILSAAVGAALLLCVGASAVAQDLDASEPPAKRLDRLERQLNEVRQIVLQARATGAPIEIKDAGPDPQVDALTTHLNEMDQTLRGLTGQVETLGHNLDSARQDVAQANAQVASLADRVDKLEKQVAAMAPPPPPPPAPPGPAADAAPPGPGDAKAAYAHAHDLLLSGDYAAAAAAYQDYVDRFSDAANIATARYWLGETKYIQADYAGAITAYAGAVKGWPRTSWAPDAIIKMSLSLAQENKTTAACGFLGEIDRRYPEASTAAKARATAARQKVGCPG